MSANLSVARPQLWNTQNDLPERIRVEAITLLNQQLADALDLHLQAKQAHWNAAAALGDADTADLFTGVSRGIDELLWKVEAHNQ
jgi:starvation-inducible DNA-binding protein